MCVRAPALSLVSPASRVAPVTHMTGPIWVHMTPPSSAIIVWLQWAFFLHPEGIHSIPFSSGRKAGGGAF